MSSHRTRPVVTRRLGTLACLALVTVLFFAVPGAAHVEASVTIGGDVAAQEAMDALGRADILPGHEAGSTCRRSSSPGENWPSCSPGPSV